MMNSKLRKWIFGLLACGIVIVFGQPPAPKKGTVVTPQPVTLGSNNITVSVPTGIPLATPLTVEDVAVVRKRIEAYANSMRSNAVRLTDLRSDGHSVENDAIERATKTASGELGSPSIARLNPLTNQSRVSVDPVLAGLARAALRSRLGRNPSPVELAAEVNTFDDQVAQVNSSLAQKRAEIGKALKRDGRIPRALEATSLGIAPVDPQTNSPIVQEGMRALTQILLTK